jgi:hypothetical protein
MLKNLFFALFLIWSTTLQAGTYYASPTGNGDGRFASHPFQIKDFWSVAKQGDVLLLLDGKYTGENSMITPPEGLSGSIGKPITVKALNDGKAEIDGENTRPVVYLRFNDYFVLEGFNVHSSGPNADVVQLDRSNNNIIRRVIAWDAPAVGNREVFAVNYGSDNLLEDVAGWGSGRKIFGLFSDTRTTLRRCFFRFTYHMDTKSFWKVAMTMGYYSTETLIENCVGTWDELPGTYESQRYAIFGTDNFGAGPHRVLGSIGYHLSTQRGTPNFIFSTVNFGPSYIIKDVIGYTDRTDNIGVFALDSKTSVTASYLTSIGGSGLGDNDFSYSVFAQNQVGTVHHIIVQNSKRNGTNVGDRFDYVRYWNNVNNYTDSAPVHFTVANPNFTANGGNILQVGLSEAERPKVDGQSVGAQIQYRYVNGVLTNEPLWPWPMNERIKAAMIVSGYDRKGGLDGEGGTDLTKTVFELGGGTLPLDRGDNVPPLPPTGVKVIVSNP